jgi:hypothetical protein
MEPVTIIITALALGASTGVKSIAEQAVKEGYEGLKNLIKTKYPSITIDRLERKPESETQRKAVEEDLADAGGDKDLEVLQKAKILIGAIENLPKQEVPAIGVNLEKIKGASLTIDDVIATGIGVNVKDGEFQGDVSIKGIRAGQQGDIHPKP